ncbi:MAG: hypothetical protein DYG98_12970 [Haliscomenobacteraceae bacterium CHB4]|nr:hypothetical protein [Haliscomenobacteraceae bacterium CHB4]
MPHAKRKLLLIIIREYRKTVMLSAKEALTKIFHVPKGRFADSNLRSYPKAYPAILKSMRRNAGILVR